MTIEQTNNISDSTLSTILKIDDVSFSYGDKQILAHLQADIRTGEFVCIVGPSGTGKTTLLQCLAGLRTPTSGTISINGTSITEPPAEMAVVFQDYSRSLMPWLTAIDNITLPLRSAGIPKQECVSRANQALQEVGLEGSGHLYPWELSGGMQQRVAIARALAYKPSVIIMDEPFASVDAQTRADLEDLTRKVKENLGITVLLVTHDIDEAVYLSDRVLVLSGKPASVAEIIDIDLGDNRDQITTKERPEFGGLRSRIYRLIRRSE